MKLLYDEVRFFRGVVEDRLDPLQQGRVRVRVVGVHPFSRIQGDFSGVPVEDLPWMSVMMPSTSPAVAGISGAITGLLPGSGVVGLWLDKYKTDGIVLGSYSGNQTNIPNSEEGFSDPNGIYPDYAGPDTSSLNAGGAYGDSAGSNSSQNANTSTGLWPGGADVTGPDDNPEFTIEKMLRGDEGVKNTVYWDSLGYPTVGIGHLIVLRKTRDMNLILRQLSADLGHSVGATIAQADITKLFISDLGKTQAEIRKNKTIGPVYAKLNRSRQMALENMAFQMGTGGLAKFKTSLALIGAGEYDKAALALKQSLWARQTPGRANRICLVIKNGNMASYGVLPRKPAPPPGAKMAVASFLPMSDEFNPFDPDDVEIVPDYTNQMKGDGIEEDLSVPYVKEPSSLLFEEPVSSYMGSYPYVQALTTEGGHTQEFDNTPGQERYKIWHPSGSYVEVAPDGRKTDKATGDLYSLAGGDRCELTTGERKVNVGGTETYINFADVIREIEGSQRTKIAASNTIEIAGDEVKKITGSGTIEVGAGIKIIVTGNADIEVSGDTNLKTANLTANIGGNWNVTAANWNVNCGAVTMNTGPVSWTTPRFDVV